MMITDITEAIQTIREIDPSLDRQTLLDAIAEKCLYLSGIEGDDAQILYDYLYDSFGVVCDWLTIHAGQEYYELEDSDPDGVFSVRIMTHGYRGHANVSSQCSLVLIGGKYVDDVYLHVHAPLIQRIPFADRADTAPCNAIVVCDAW